MSSIRIAQSDEDIAGCFQVMQQLRPHLVPGAFVARVRLQEKGGYQLAYLEANRQVQSVAGFRLIENLSRGRVLYVDDLVTDAANRSHGYGRELLAWLIERAHNRGCQSFELDSGVQRFEAHRFYLSNRMFISGHHFRLMLDSAATLRPPSGARI
jgi:GNAT superfamily N-acetyltransferase